MIFPSATPRRKRGVAAPAVLVYSRRAGVRTERTGSTPCSDGGSWMSVTSRPPSTRDPLWSPLARPPSGGAPRSEEHTSELQSLMRISYAVFCLTKKHNNHLSKSSTTHNHINKTKTLKQR